MTERLTSLRESTLGTIAEFLIDEKFEVSSILKEGILELINLISDYYEEGKHLFPEVIITNNSNELFKSLSNREILIAKKDLSIKEFKNILKLCSPLANGSWIIYIEINGDKLKYGLADAEISITSPSIYEQTLGSVKVDLPGINIAYIRNIGSKVVELVGFKNRYLISLTLEKLDFNQDVIKKITDKIIFNCREDIKIPLYTFLNKTLQHSINSGHGNLIGIVNDSEEDINKLIEILKDGIYLSTPIDLCEHVLALEEEKTDFNAKALFSYSEIFGNMLNHDGITVITNTAKVLGYHLFIEPKLSHEEETSGGARTRAFLSMINWGIFISCFYKSQDGNTKIWLKDE